jgi:hypothetical protein
VLPRMTGTCSAILLLCASLLAQDQPDATADRSSAIAADAQLIAPLSDGLRELHTWPEPFNMAAALREWVVWPPDAEATPADAARDRSAEIPHGRIRVARSPDEARGDAAMWIRDLLREEWVPADLRERVILIQDDDAAKSRVLCRYDVDGHQMQVVQSSWCVCTVIRPRPGEIAAVDARDYAAAVFRLFFAHGEEVATTALGTPLGAFDGLEVFSPGRTPDDWSEEMRAFEHWWIPAGWYSDGTAIAVVTGKSDIDNPTIPTHETPWF